MDRREFIRMSTALAGLALLAPACHSAKPIPGEIVGASASIGHLLRDGHFGPPVSSSYCEVAIVGGGISGLSAARWLRKKGIRDIKLLDLENHAGGNASCGKNKVSAYPWGAHYVPIPNNDLVDYCSFLEESGVITGRDDKGLPIYNEYHLCFDPQERLYINGRWQDGLVPGPGLPTADRHEVERFMLAMDKFRYAKGHDGADAFAIPIDRSSKDPVYTALDDMTMLEWLRSNGYRSPWLYGYVNYCTRDDFGTPSDHISAWTGIHYFAARKGLGANAKHEDVLTWPEGNGWLVKQLCSSISDCLMTNALVIGISPDSDGISVLYYDTKDRLVKAIHAKQIILAVPQFVANRILPNNPQRIADVTAHMHYTPWMVANLTVGELEERAGAPLSWDNVIFDSPSLGYVEATHQQIAQLKEKKVLTYYWPLTDAEPADARKMAQQRSHADWVSLVLNDLKKVHPDIEDKTENIDIMIWGHAMAQPRPGWIHGPIRRTLQQSADPRIHFAHTDLAGISIFEEGFYQGIAAAEKVLSKA